ncbi:hypothetical protein [Wenzhouxiangella marina]|uniref:Uncharacterized protein n=1 Tax=Wenzhouxiangella marina TaxID=1579979 RepID=A0A0K0XRZ5_9GAMM|nr:hypothetical protein [Wenzhouxiangella marina]AKS40463.1 hypothetical protein WM2015_72 [Wenzhouxiangella marina]MBB6088215.1 hypothetical protein [Wenzhouxiangella marina]
MVVRNPFVVDFSATKPGPLLTELNFGQYSLVNALYYIALFEGFGLRSGGPPCSQSARSSSE